MTKSSKSELTSEYSVYKAMTELVSLIQDCCPESSQCPMSQKQRNIRESTNPAKEKGR